MATKLISNRLLSMISIIGFVLLATSCEDKEDSPTTLPPYEGGYAEADFPEVNDEIPSGSQINWSSEATLISHNVYSADYGRVHRINSSELILTYHCGPVDNTYDNIALRKSYDNGASWSEPQIVVEDNDPNYYGFANPETIVLSDGVIILAYIGRGLPDDNQHGNVQIKRSEDGGETWGPAQIVATGRSWEPAMMQTSEGEIQLFYSSEAKWWFGLNASPEVLANVQQEILLIRSTDSGLSWSAPKTVAYTSGMRDGMPVPLELANDKGYVFSIESVNNSQSPFIIWSSTSASWNYFEHGSLANQRRWLATDAPIWGGGPYLIQTQNGNTIMSVHDTGGRPVTDWHKNTMLVLVGNDMAQNFTNVTYPWPNLPVNEGAINNSLFMKNPETVVAITSRIYADGHGEVYWKEGQINF